MGCGASVLRPEDHHNNPGHYKLGRPITEEPPNKTTPPPLNVPSFRHHDQLRAKDERDDAITGAASPSFREYCVVSRSSSCDLEHSHDDDPDVVQTSDNNNNNNMDNDDPMAPSRNEITNPRKEGEKKERKGGKLREVINKGRAGGKKIGLVRHRSDNRAGKLT